jgi:hypothetical protein
MVMATMHRPPAVSQFQDLIIKRVGKTWSIGQIKSAMRGLKTTGKKKSRPVLAVNLPKYYEELTLSFSPLTPL